MTKTKEKAKKYPTQTAVFITRDESLMLWQMINQRAVAVHPADGATAKGLYDKLKWTADELGVTAALAAAGSNAIKQA